MRQQWDSFIDSVEVLDCAESGRLQVVRTRYKETAGLRNRELVEKKLYFCYQESPEEIKTTKPRRRDRRGRARSIESLSVAQLFSSFEEPHI